MGPIKQTIRRFRPPAALAIKQMPPRPTINEEDIEESFLKGSGPGGQKINKTSSAVQLKHLPTGLVVKSQATRSRTQNRKIARGLLAEKLEEMEKGPESRRAVKAEIAKKRKASKTKKAKRKYRNMGRGEGATGAGEGEGIDDEICDDEELPDEAILRGDSRGDSRGEVNSSDTQRPERTAKSIS